MPVDSFAFPYGWSSIEQDIPANSTTAVPSVHTGEDHGVALAAGGGLAESGPLSEVWQACVDAVVAKLTQRDEVLEDFLGAWLQVSQMTGVLSAAGAAAAAHGVVGAPSRALWVGAFYQGASGEAKPLIVVSVDGSNVNVSGGTASAAYRITMIFSTVGAGW